MEVAPTSSSFEFPQSQSSAEQPSISTSNSSMPVVTLQTLHTAVANSSFSEDPLFKLLVEAVNTLAQKVTRLETETHTLNSEKNAAVAAAEAAKEKVTRLETETHTLNSEKSAAVAVAEATKEIKKHKYFFYDTIDSLLNGYDKSQIDSITSCLRDRPYLHLILEGHCDSNSYFHFSLVEPEKLPERRCELLKKSFDSKLHPRFSISGKGNSAPLDFINPSAIINRRICVKVDKEKSLRAYLSVHSGQSH